MMPGNNQEEAFLLIHSNRENQRCEPSSREAPAMLFTAFYPFTHGVSRDFQENSAFVVNSKELNPALVGRRDDGPSKYRLPAGLYTTYIVRFVWYA